MYISYALLVLFIPSVALQIDNIDKSKWLDQADPFNSIPMQVMKQQEQEEKVVKQTYLALESDRDLSRLSTSVGPKVLQPSSEDSSTERCSESKPTVNVTMFFKRHIANLLTLLQYQTPMRDTQFYSMHIELTAKQRHELKEFVMNRGSIHEVDDILATMFMDAEPTSFDGAPLSSMFMSPSVQMLGVTLSILGTIYLIMKLSLYRVLMLLFTCTFMWNCLQMYQVAIVKRHSEMVKHSAGMPRSCMPEKWVWYESVKFWFQDSFSDDSCLEYHKMLLIDPMWDVNPSVAASDAIAMFLLHPLERLGGQIGLFYKRMHQNSPPVVFWLLVPLSSIFVIIFTLAYFGYGIHVPFLFSIGPQRTPLPITENEQLSRDRIEDCPHKNKDQLKEAVDEKSKLAVNENDKPSTSCHRKQVEELSDKHSNDQPRDQTFTCTKCRTANTNDEEEINGKLS